MCRYGAGVDWICAHGERGFGCAVVAVWPFIPQISPRAGMSNVCICVYLKGVYVCESSWVYMSVYVCISKVCIYVCIFLCFHNAHEYTFGFGGVVVADCSDFPLRTGVLRCTYVCILQV